MVKIEINQILCLAQHHLHLCNNSNIEEIVSSYLIDSDVFVTADVESWEEKFRKLSINCQIKIPDAVSPKERIVVDSSSLGDNHKFWEEKWKKQVRVVCIYNIDKLNLATLKSLVDIHDKMILSVDKVRMLSDKNLEKEVGNINPEIVEDLVKKELKNIVLSFLLSEPMSGVELVKLLYQKFKVFVSPGMIYPLLHELEKNGLLMYEYKLKNKIYRVEKKEEVEFLLKKYTQANSIVRQFLLME